MQKNSEGNIEFNLTNIAQLTTFTIAITVSFTMVRLYLYYVILLHIPIFQYLEASDMVLMVPTGIWWALYMGAIQGGNFMQENKKIGKWQRVFYGASLYLFAGFITWVGYRNDPILEQVLILPFQYWFYGIIPFVLYILLRMNAKVNKNDFFVKNKYVAIFVITMWYGAFDSFANYNILVHPSKRIELILKLKNGSKIRTNLNTIYAGRCKSYWFLYDRKTAFTRAIKNEDIEVVDYNSYLKLSK